MTKAAIDLQQSQILVNNSLERLLRFAEADTVSFREGSGELGQRQEELLNPVIDQFQDQFDIELKKGASKHHPN